MDTKTFFNHAIGSGLVAATLSGVAYDHAQVSSEAKALGAIEFYRTPTAHTSVKVLPSLTLSSSEAATFAASSVLGADGQIFDDDDDPISLVAIEDLLRSS